MFHLNYKYIYCTYPFLDSNFTSGLKLLQMTEASLLERLFREGSEPNGVRVHSYSELGFIDDITSSLDPEDLRVIRESQFGKLLDIPVGAAYSGKLIHFLLSRQLVVKKQKELWMGFGGSPLRFSLHEFQRVTGLICSKPLKDKRKKGKRKIVPGKYWFKLFERGDVSVDWVVGRLKKRLVSDRDTRLRYAVLALIDGVLCPTSGNTENFSCTC